MYSVITAVPMCKSRFISDKDGFLDVRKICTPYIPCRFLLAIKYTTILNDTTYTVSLTKNGLKNNQ